VCPGVLTGLKLSLNSLARDFSKATQEKRIPGFESQKTVGLQVKTRMALIQLTLRPNHKTFGSKIENRFPIIS